MNRTDQFSEVREIADAVCSDVATQEQLEKLERLLSGDFAAQEFYYDYINMHAQLKKPTANNMEIIYRRMTEEFVIRQQSDSANDKNDYLDQPTDYKRPRITQKVIVIALLVLTCVILSIWWFTTRTGPTHIAQVIKGTIAPQGTQAKLDGEYLFTGDYKTEHGATLQLEDGSLIKLAPHSIIKLFNHNEVRLKRGKLELEPGSAKNIIVHSKKTIMTPNGSRLTYDLTHNLPRLITGKETRIMPLRWRPTHYWGFNGTGDRVTDLTGNSHGIPTEGADRIVGEVGNGAFRFNSGSNARIEVGSGGGTVLGTGSFAVTDGVTIEALIKPSFSGQIGDIDTIFRKDHDDGEHKILLSFQHGVGKSSLKPQGDLKQNLSFGLFILGQGYHELNVALDGENGRPSLADLTDGQYHHIAATYNTYTGLKAIYIDGKRHAFYQYPAGSKVLSGGPGTATIGNNPSKDKWHKEVFSGAIDEVAFYDFALPEFMVQQHFQTSQQGLNYYGLPANDQPLPFRPKLQLPEYITLELDYITGLPKRVIED
ncbi:pentaxin domain-containing protein [Catenovulum agarivorans DS-2]|uniref:Pentaxin domain-containing protein n=1 Tax=Catenovulum agarivorans DS-2 TaxID=1328313 RepID=W7QTT5_9ALTE|nr:LamG-like jellyroll fold domain-containing protein [Catenovulum agarivorans]EWH08845.1 pentaxin domain-containing protein [Catenovulum agarivorans DS-2]